MNKIAFGTYRITHQNPLHIEALVSAIESGVILIDTSSNYMNGDAERAIAVAMSRFDDEIQSRVEIVSKFGYIQGENMLRHKEKAYEGVVEFDESCFHSIAPSFMRDQLSRSLERLNIDKIDCYLLHNPEYFLLDALKKDADRDEVLDMMFERIYEVFVALEEEVRDGRIGSYGISSNSFAKSRKDAEFLPYEDLCILADKASEKVGNETHSFTTVQLPINILEQEGLKCAAWAKQNDLRVLANRPLNAQKEHHMYRLAEYEESASYYNYLNELLEMCENETLQPLYNLLSELDQNKHKFGWIGDFDQFLYAQILPHIQKTLQKLSQEELDMMLEHIDAFFAQYRQMVAYECGKSTRIMLKDEFGTCNALLQECAMKFLLEQQDIDYILVGMRKPSYVAQTLALIS